MYWAYMAHTQTAGSVAHSATTTGRLGLAMTLVAFAVMFVPFAIVLFIACRASDRSRSDEGDGDSGRGGGGPGGPRRPTGGPPLPDGDPAWWPEFERQFLAYVECPRRVHPVSASAR